MALIACPECGREVSTEAKACPACGYPLAERSRAAAPSPQAQASAMDAVDTQTVLLEVRPSWWRYFWWLCFAWLIIPLIVAWVKRSATVLRIYRGRITLERGLLNKCESEFFMRDVRAIDIDQSFVSRLVGIGDITISTAATVEGSERIEGIPDPHKIRDMIIAQRQGQ